VLAKRFLSALMEPRVLRLRRLVIANADRFPELGRSWYDEGFARVLATLAQCFERMHAAGALEIADASLAANHFVGMLLWIPINKAMFTGNEKPYSTEELEAMAESSVRAFLAAYGVRESRNAAGRTSSKRRAVSA
jgi:TetR/AcrR family transcriptional regulator, mexJK operon transcriptional repressor